MCKNAIDFILRSLATAMSEQPNLEKPRRTSRHRCDSWSMHLPRHCGFVWALSAVIYAFALSARQSPTWNNPGCRYAYPGLCADCPFRALLLIFAHQTVHPNMSIPFVQYSKLNLPARHGNGVRVSSCATARSVCGSELWRTPYAKKADGTLRLPSLRMICIWITIPNLSW